MNCTHPEEEKKNGSNVRPWIAKKQKTIDHEKCTQVSPFFKPLIGVMTGVVINIRINRNLALFCNVISGSSEVTDMCLISKYWNFASLCKSVLFAKILHRSQQFPIISKVLHFIKGNSCFYLPSFFFLKTFTNFLERKVHFSPAFRVGNSSAAIATVCWFLA